MPDRRTGIDHRAGAQNAFLPDFRDAVFRGIGLRGASRRGGQLAENAVIEDFRAPTDDRSRIEDHIIMNHHALFDDHILMNHGGRGHRGLLTDLSHLNLPYAKN